MINRQIVSVDTATLRQYEGNYRMESELGRGYTGFRLTVTAQGEHLSVKVGDNEQVDVYPNSPTCFFHENADFQITFEPSNSNKTVECVIQMGGIKVRGLRTP